MSEASGSRHPLLVVVDDDDALRAAIVLALQRHRYRVVAYADTAAMQTALDCGDLVLVDVDALLLDMRMPGVAGVQLQAELTQLDPGLPIVFISGESSLHEVNQAWKQGAVDFLLKPFETDALLRAVSSACARRRRDDPVAMVPGQRLATLSSREREVLLALVAGARNAEIAQQLGISERTVKLHRRNLRDKLGLDRVADLVRFHELNREHLA